jgi:hypothetical protein
MRTALIELPYIERHQVSLHHEAFGMTSGKLTEAKTG